MRGSEVIAQALEEHGVEYVFGLCGHGILGFMDAFHDRKDRIRLVSVRHESAAGFMADAYYRVSRRPVATYTSCGPGSANLIIALASAFMDSSAFVAITGNVPTQQFNRGPFQETGRYYQGDFPSVVRHYAKRVYQPTRADMVPLAIRQALHLAITPKPGPVVVDVPLNVFVEEAEIEPSALRPAYEDIETGCPANEAGVQAAVEMLLRAERPLIALGGGFTLSQAWPELCELVSLVPIPFHYSPQGKVGVDERHPLALGATGRNGTLPANAAGRHADVILALGHSFDDRTTSAWMPGVTYNIPPTRLIQVDIDPAEIGRNYPVALGLVGDVRATLRRMVEVVRDRINTVGYTPRDAWLTQIGDWKKRWNAHREEGVRKSGRPVPPARLLAELRRALPAEGYLLSDVGLHHNWIVQLWENRDPGHLLQSWGYSAMGFGVCGALGVALAAPGKPVVAFVGDAGFSMHSHVVATAVEYGLPVVWVVFNNRAFGSIWEQQLGYFRRGELATRFYRKDTGQPYSPDYARMAEAYGAQGFRVEDSADLPSALAEALRAETPVVVDVYVDTEARLAGTGSWMLPPLAGPAPEWLE